MSTKIHEDVKIAKGAIICGDVEIEEGVSIWYHAVLRGDAGPIRIGKNTNIQDGVVIHQGMGEETIIGEGVTVGHNAILHGCHIGDYSLIGMGAIILDQAVIGKHCIIGAGSLVTGKKIIPDGSLVFGNPAKIIRPLTEEEIRGNYQSVKEYARFRQEL